MQKYTEGFMHLMKPLGPWGVLVASAIDSASVPLPIDILVAGWAWADRQHFYLYAILAAAGSAIGGLVPFFLGRGGGELFLLRHINRQRFEALRGKFERQEFLAILIPSLLPPPATWKLFVFGAGVFEMRTATFMLAVFLGRMVRFGVETALTVKYGPQIVTAVGDLAKRHLVVTLVVLAIIFGGLGWWMWRKLRGTGDGEATNTNQPLEKREPR